MNRNIEVINENLLAVNIQYVKEGYVEELKFITTADKEKTDQIYLSNTGKIILDSGARAYPILKKMFLVFMQKPTDELMETMKMPKRDSLDGLCENVIGWELKRRCVKAEYMKNLTQSTFKNKFIKWIRKKVKICQESKLE